MLHVSMAKLMAMRPREKSTMEQALLERTKVGELWKSEKGDGVRCYACGHRCFIPEGFQGICKVRSNVAGELRVPWGYAAGIQVDPIEKKPFFHVYPGTDALSFGMLGCDFHCAYCQNWITSQTLRDPLSTALPREVTAETLAGLAQKSGVRVLTSTYNEPLITSEWAVEVFKEGKKKGLRGSYVSNGNGTPEVLEYIRPWVDFYKIDLKSFRDKSYREMGGVLERVLDTVKRVHAMGFWLEIVTLVVPGFNDSDAEMGELAEFLVSVSKDIPWHVTAFHPDYKMQGPPRTSVETVTRIGEIGKKAGLRYVYLGNLPGRVGEWENTYCPSCKELLVERQGFRVLQNRLEGSKCPRCEEVIPGVWE